MRMDKPKKPKRPGADRRWTLLLIGDHGNVISLKHFKVIVIGIGFLFFFAVGLAAVIFFQHKETLKQNKDLKKWFSESEKQIEKLRHEKEILMARLVRAQARTKENGDSDRQNPKNMKDTQPQAPAPEDVPKSQPPKVVEENLSAPQPARPTPAPEPPKPENEEVEPVISVALENFKASRESGNNNLTAQFKIKNTSKGANPPRADGRIVVVLKAEDLQKDQWLVMPAVGLSGERPSGKRGKSFSIQRFRTMNFTAKAPHYSHQFETAAVYVFTKTGELLLEQDFSIKFPLAPVRSALTPSDQTASGETTSNRKSGAESPENGGAVDSLNRMPPVF
jgi:uncharacterized protein YdaU (DUF1376 family)